MNKEGQRAELTSKKGKAENYEVAGKDANHSAEKEDFTHIASLLVIALVVGVYLITTTVLIAGDGVIYIERAREFSSDPIKVIKGWLPFGYPFLIFLSHKFIALFGNNSSLQTWIYSAQGVTLLCRVFAVIPLYFIGRLLVGNKKSFLAILILLILPYPAEFGSDVLRDWPHVLFLATGFLFLLLGAKQGKWWMLGMTGLSAGLGFTIRLECAQLVIYGFLWLVVGFFLPKPNMTRPKIACALFALLIGFAITAGPYMGIRGEGFLPPKVKKLINFSCRLPPERIQNSNISSCDDVCEAASLPGNLVEAIVRVFEVIGENLMYFFVLPLVIGLYHRFGKKSEATDIERFFVPAFIVFNVVILILLYCNYNYINRRHSLPIIVFTIFYVPIGLQIMADWLKSKGCIGRSEANQHPRVLFFVLLAAGIAICLPKLVRPVRIEKQCYKEAAMWLKENTTFEDDIAVPDSRISFYAERRGIVYDKKVPERGSYVVRIFKDNKEIPIGIEILGAKKVFSTASSDKRSNIIIYDLRGHISESVSFVDYSYEKIAEGQYKFSFLFKVNNGFEKDWIIYFHGAVEDANIDLLPKDRQKYKFSNWDFNPKPATSAWPRNEDITITTEISAKPISYYVKLGFFMAKDGRHGREINLGWVDLGDTKQGDDR